mmetsp:Transcript_22885/g.38328  ORF Transcript_22885/g.38328 Transcript_22885/m.38328 type:complete len:434 (+) Transcript_22885:3121-4422(+)
MSRLDLVIFRWGRIIARRVNRRRDRLEVQVFLRLALARIGDGNRLHQCLGIGMLRVLEHAGARAQFDDPTQIHHTHMVADAFDHGHIVADKEERQTHLGLQFHHQVQHLRLHRHIQRRHSFVRDDQLGVQRQSASDGHPLALPTGQFVREAAHEAARQLHPVKQHLDALTPLFAFEHAKVVHRLGHLIGQLHLGVQRGKGILKDHLHIDPRGAQIAITQRHDVLAVQHDRAFLRIHQAQDRPTRCGFAKAAFAHKAQGLALVDGKGQVLDRMNIGHKTAKEAALDRKARGETLDLQQRLFGAGDGHDRRLIAPHQFHRLGIGLAGHLTQLGHRGQQRLRIRVLRIFEHRAARSNFYDPAQVHHAHMVAHAFHNRHIVADEHIGNPQLGLQFHHQVQHLRLHRYIKSGDRFIRHNQLRVQGQRAGNCDPLALTT